jgi:transposase
MAPAKSRYMSEEEKRLAWIWSHEDNEDVSEIASRLRRDETSIRRFVKSGKFDTQRHGRPRALTEQQIDRLVAFVNLEVKKAKGEYAITQDFIHRRFRPKVCVRVIAEALHQRGMWFHKLREKPLLTEEDVRVRFAFAKRYLKCSSDWWLRHVQLHIDNKVFKVPANKGTRHILATRKVRGTYRTSGRGLHAEHVRPGRGLRQGSGVRGVCVTGGACSEGIVLWHIVNGTWCGETAAEVYRGPILKALRKTYPGKRSFKVLEDNDPVGNQSKRGHAAKRECKITTVEFPKRSPDLNVLDYFVWSYVETRLRRQERSWEAGRQESRAEFIMRLKGTAQRIPASLLQKAIGNLASRVPLFIYQQFASM